MPPSHNSGPLMPIGGVPIHASCGVTSTRAMVRFGAILMFCLCSVYAADSLDATLARIDQAAKTFKGMTADIVNTEYTALVDSKDVHSGTIKLLLAKDGTHVLMNRDDGTVLSFDGHTGRSYNPKTNVVDERNISSNVVNQYLLLGFGVTSAQLKASYDISYSGTEQIGNQQTSHLTLIPKSPDMRKDMKQAELWIGENGLVVQQKILRPDGDYEMIAYSNMTQGAIPEKDLEIK